MNPSTRRTKNDRLTKHRSANPHGSNHKKNTAKRLSSTASWTFFLTLIIAYILSYLAVSNHWNKHVLLELNLTTSSRRFLEEFKGKQRDGKFTSLINKKEEPNPKFSNRTTNSSLQLNHTSEKDLDLALFIDPSELSLRDGFSATWWQSVDRFLEFLNPNPIHNQHMMFVEGASFAFYEFARDDVRMTRDWLQFAVEHTSKAWKQVGYEVKRNTLPYVFYVDQLMKYIRQTLASLDSPEVAITNKNRTNSNLEPQLQQSDDPTAMQETIALIAFMPYRNYFNSTRAKIMTMANLGATLTSLIRVRCGRILVVVDNTDWDEHSKIIWSATLEMLQSSQQDLVERSLWEKAFLEYAKTNKTNHISGEWIRGTNDSNSMGRGLEVRVHKTELSIVVVNCSEHEGTVQWNRGNKRTIKTIPMAGLVGIRKAFLSLNNSKLSSQRRRGSYAKHTRGGGDPIDARQWLGPSFNMTVGCRWKYIYLTEPDSVLVTKQSALMVLSAEIDKGKIAIPHRLQPVPHNSDIPIQQHDPQQPYKTRNNILPAEGPFEQVQNIVTIEKHPVPDTWPNESRTVDVCCDQGPDHPGATAIHLKRLSRCDNFWFLCGFGPNKTLDDHYRLFSYQLIRLVDGTGITTLAANAHGRQCRPQQITVPNPLKDESSSTLPLCGDSE